MSNLENTDMSDYWNGDGGHEWIRFQRIIDKGLTPFGERAMEVANLQFGEKVLDIGCGCGDTSFEISRRIGKEGYVQGVDISNLLLNKAKSKVPDQTIANVSFECADAQVHSFRGAYYDVMFSRNGVMFFNEPILAFSNIRRALKPNGRLVFICWQPVKENQWVNLPLTVAANFVQLPEPTDPESPGGFSFGDPARIERILSSSGFDNISIQEFSGEFLVGETLHQAVDFLSNIGPASNAIKSSEMEAEEQNLFDSALHELLLSQLRPEGVKLDAAMWIVTANNR